MDPAIRASPYEPGLYFVSPEPGTTLQSIGTTEWKVGERYKLQKVLGYGSFSCVCLAIDTITGERVALKRIGDVLHSADQAKRVLREISILRRTAHPNLIGLRDCFLRPSATGQCRMINGRLVNCSIDLYIAMEFAEGGDLFHMRGQLAPAEVTSLLWQMLQAVQYLHSLHIWHRDIKSQNAFVHWEKGVRVIKLGDFGSARSALLYDLEQKNPLKRDHRGVNKDDKHPQNGKDTTTNIDMNGGEHQQRQQRRRPLSAFERSFKQMDEAMLTEDLYANINEGSTDISDSIGIDEDLSNVVNEDTAQSPQKQKLNHHHHHHTRQHHQQHHGLVNNMAHSISSRGRGFKAPLTRVVATPCYRAPEVVMSRGGYSSALDTWGIGCIFGELLQRVAYIGSASNPNLAVAPLFALRCFPKTPETGETFGRPECSGTRRELQALFDVVGTPSWRDAAAVEMEEWRRYLERLPGKAPTLYRRFKSAGEVAVHLLTRLLDFDPTGRANCEEALAHEFFAAIREELNISTTIVNLNNRNTTTTRYLESRSLSQMDTGMRDSSTASLEGLAAAGGGGGGGGGGVRREEEGEDAEMADHDGDGDVVIQETNSLPIPVSPTGDILSSDMRVLSFDGPDLGETLSVDAAAAAATLEALHSAELLVTRVNSAGVDISGGGGRNNTSNTTDGITMQQKQQQQPSSSSSSSLSSLGGVDGVGAEASMHEAAAAETEVNPGKALASLEEELETISESAPGGVFDPSSEGCQRLRQLLEAEIAAAAAEAAARTASRTATLLNNTIPNASGGNATAAAGANTTTTTTKALRDRLASGSAKLDVAALGRNASLDYGRERLSNVADTVQGRELDPNKFLGSNRHGEWTAQGGGGSVAPGPRWGVSALPPGVNAEDPRLKEIIKKQQGR